MVNQAILTKDNPVADVLFGIDNTFLSRALGRGTVRRVRVASAVGRTRRTRTRSRTSSDAHRLRRRMPQLRSRRLHRSRTSPCRPPLLELTDPTYAEPSRRRRPGDLVTGAGLPARHHRGVRRDRRLHVGGLLAGPRRQRRPRCGRAGKRPTTASSPERATAPAAGRVVCLVPTG